MLNKYGDKGLKVLAFPCNQFGAQEPGDASVIQEKQASYGIDKHWPNFLCYEKCDVVGDNAEPCFKWLQDTIGKEITWNFFKFLVSPNGVLLKMWDHKTDPASVIQPVVEDLLY